MEEFLQLPWDSPETKDVNSSFISDSALKMYSSTYKILHDQLQQIFSDDSLSENDDRESQGKTRSDGNGALQGTIQVRNKVQMCKKPNVECLYLLEGSYFGDARFGVITLLLKAHYLGYDAVTEQYIPCFSNEVKLNYPKKSSLNAEQQSLFLQLMIKYAKKCPFPTPVDEKELQQYKLLYDKVVAERFEFAHFVRQRCAMTQDRYHLINPDVKKYIEEVWQHRLSQVSKYPARYEPLRLLSLVYADNKRSVLMTMKENLLEVGSSPGITLPKFKTPVYVLTDYSKVKKRFPPSVDTTRNAHSAPVSQDRLAENLAIANAVHVVISSSGLKRIIDNHPPNYEKAWDLPVTVKEYRQCENKTFKIVYVDKALPPRCLTTMEKNLWFHKFGVKSLICHRRHPECSESGRNASSINDYKFSGNKEGCEIEAVDDTGQNLDSVAAELKEGDLELNCSTEDCTAMPLKRKHIDSECESGVSTDDENRLVIDCSDMEGRSNEKKCAPVRNGRKSISQRLSEHNNVEDSRVTRSKARLLYANQSIGENSTQFAANEDCEMESTSKCKGAPEATDGSGLEKSLGGVMVPNSFDAAESTLYSEVCGSVDVPQGDCMRSYSVNISMGNEQDCCASQQCSAQELSEEEQTKMKREEFNLSNLGLNVSYRLWKLCKDEGHLEDRKKGFLKGECPDREINVLVRCKVDGHRIEHNKKQSFCVVPKMEYLPEYGAQCLTPSEQAHQWISLYVRPGSELYRARVNACTSEVMMIERHSVQEVAQEAVQVGRPNSVMLGTLYNVLLGLTDLEAGSYLLSHTPKLGAFVNVLQSVGSGRFSLRDMYTIDTKATAVSDGSLWIPIDHNVVTPFHRACNRVPGMFPPTCFVRGKPLSKKCSRKKRKKKKSK